MQQHCFRLPATEPAMRSDQFLERCHLTRRRVEPAEQHEITNVPATVESEQVGSRMRAEDGHWIVTFTVDGTAWREDSPAGRPKDDERVA
jgi:hypothetical protein